MFNGRKLTRGDRRRSERLARLRAIVRRDHAAVGDRSGLRQAGGGVDRSRLGGGLPGGCSGTTVRGGTRAPSYSPEATLNG